MATIFFLRPSPDLSKVNINNIKNVTVVGTLEIDRKIFV